MAPSRFLRSTVAIVALALAGASAPATRKTSTFHNPIARRGADPQVILAEDGYYYWIRSARGSLAVSRTRDVTDFYDATSKLVWTPPPGTPHSKELWAPELHKIGGRWYVYYCADDGSNDNHRMYVLEGGTGASPFDAPFQMKARLKTDAGDNWAIDPTVFERNGAHYICWSGWPEKVVKDETACIYIAKLENPWTIGSDRVEISRPTYDWEQHWKNPPEWHNTPGRRVWVNEGPAVIRHGDKLFLTYSASGCWTPYYCLGMLTADASADLLNPASWKKSAAPVFQQSPEDHVFGTGHNSFVTSPDGKEDWLVYHASDNPDECGGALRSPRMQKITWRPDGTPDFGKPSPHGAELTKPSGL